MAYRKTSVEYYRTMLKQAIILSETESLMIKCINLKALRKIHYQLLSERKLFKKSTEYDNNKIIHISISRKMLTLRMRTSKVLKNDLILVKDGKESILKLIPKIEEHKVQDATLVSNMLKDGLELQEILNVLGRDLTDKERDVILEHNK